MAIERRCALGLMVAVLATASLPALAVCDLAEKRLLGSWAHASGRGFFEEMAFESDGKSRSFSSWLHQRPEISGASWSLKDCRLTIDNSGSLSFKFVVAIDKNGQLELREGKDAAPATYKRIP